MNDAGALRAEGHANADLACALVNGVGDDSVDSDNGEKNGNACERGHDLGSETSPRDREGQKSLHWYDVGDGLIFVDAQNGLAEIRDQRARIAFGADNESHELEAEFGI